MFHQMDIDTLKNKRKAIKVSCTRIRNYVDLTQKINVNIVNQLKIRQEKLDGYWNGYWNDYKNIQTQIELIEKIPELQERDAFETAYFDLSARIRGRIDNFQGDQRSRISISSNNINMTQATNDISQVRLPKLNLPVFSGKYQE